MHDHDTGEDRAVDAAAHPGRWTTRARLVRAVLGGAGPWAREGSRPGGRLGRRGGGPSETDGRGPGADLMVALVRGRGDRHLQLRRPHRYGHLDVDSNPPDARIAPGGPDDNAFTAEVLAAADHLHRRTALPTRRHRSGPVGSPAATPLERVWRPDADLRDALDLPVLIVAGHWAGATSGLAEAIAAGRRPDDAEIVSTRAPPAARATSNRAPSR